MAHKFKQVCNLSQWVLLGILSFIGLTATADDYSASWGPAIGTSMPLLAASDQDGQARSLTNLAGDQGLLLFLSRSADW